MIGRPQAIAVGLLTASFGGSALSAQIAVTGALLSPFDEVVTGAATVNTRGRVLVFYVNESKTTIEKSQLRCSFMRDGSELETRNIPASRLAPKAQAIAVIKRVPDGTDRVVCHPGGL